MCLPCRGMRPNTDELAHEAVIHGNTLRSKERNIRQSTLKRGNDLAAHYSPRIRRRGRCSVRLANLYEYSSQRFRPCTQLDSLTK